MVLSGSVDTAPPKLTDPFRAALVPLPLRFTASREVRVPGGWETVSNPNDAWEPDGRGQPSEVRRRLRNLPLPNCHRNGDIHSIAGLDDPRQLPWPRKPGLNQPRNPSMSFFGILKRVVLSILLILAPTACGSATHDGIASSSSSRMADSPTLPGPQANGASVEIDGHELTMADPDNYAFKCYSVDTPPPNESSYYTKWNRTWIRNMAADKLAHATPPIVIQVEVQMSNGFANPDSGDDSTRGDYPYIKISVADTLAVGTEYRVDQEPVSGAWKQDQNEGTANISFAGDTMTATGTANKYATVQTASDVQHTPEGSVQYSIKLPCRNEIYPPHPGGATPG
jgi:hypothetical protein